MSTEEASKEWIEKEIIRLISLPKPMEPIAAHVLATKIADLRKLLKKMK